MKNRLLSIALSSLLGASSLSAVVVEHGWGMYGFSSDVNLTQTFGSQTDIAIVWAYDSTNMQWKAYSPNTSISDQIGQRADIASIDQLHVGEGCWILNSGMSSIDTGSSTTPSSVSVSGVIVDPYISGAELYQDTNGDGMYTAGEPISMPSDINGSFEFTEALTAGKHINIYSQGVHEGEFYDLNISAIVNSMGGVDVVSPLTTFQAKGLTPTQIAEVLNKAATDRGISNWSVDSSTILNNPLAGDLALKTVAELTNADLANIQASLASYGILKVMEGSTTLKALSGHELYVSGTTSGGALNEIAKAMLGGITNSLNTSLLSSIQTNLDTAESYMSSFGTYVMPETNAGTIITVGLIVMDRLTEIGYTTCNSTIGTDEQKVSAALIQVELASSTVTSNSNIMEIGLKIVAMKNKDMFNSMVFGQGITFANADFSSYGVSGDMLTYVNLMQDGLNDANSGYKSVRYDSTNNIVSVGMN
jgi:hypothetical protein